MLLDRLSWLASLSNRGVLDCFVLFFLFLMQYKVVRTAKVATTILVMQRNIIIALETGALVIVDVALMLTAKFTVKAE